MINPAAHGYATNLLYWNGKWEPIDNSVANFAANDRQTTESVSVFILPN